MSKKLIYFTSIVLVSILSIVSYGEQVIGNWEDDNLDGWEICTLEPPGNTELYPGDANGVTLGSGSLKMVNDLEWKFAIMLNLLGNDLTDEFFANDTFSIDITRLADEWTRGTGDHWSGLILIVNSDAGWYDLGDDDSGWSSEDGDVTLTASWNYSEHKAQLTNPNYLEFFIVTNTGGYTDGGIWYLDNARLTGSVFARDPDPEDEEPEVPTEPTLRWTSGDYADTHDVYFGTDEDVVNDANRSVDPCGVLVKQDHNTNSIDIADEVGVLEFGETYYWRIDEVNENIWAPEGSPWKGYVWSFTTGYYLTVEDFEEYTNTDDLNDVWHVTGSDISLEDTIVNNGLSSMQYDYTNDTLPYYTEAYADTNGPNSLGIGPDWTTEDVKVLSLYFKGYLPAGSFTVNPGPPVTYTIESDGWDIWDTSDGFHYAYKVINANAPPGSITAKVESIENTHEWAKAGVMMRYTLDADSQTVYVVMTPGNGVSFQWRKDAGGITEYTNITGVTAPQWVRLSYGSFNVDEVFYNYKGEYADGSIAEPGESDWQLIDYANVLTGLDWYIGLCVSSHNEVELCTAEFSDVNMTGTITGEWDSNDIGIISNDGEPMYVTLEDGDSNQSTIYHDDPNATQIGVWTEWTILLDEFIDVNLKDVQKMYIGIGDPCAGGTGTVHFDDIRLYEPYCVLTERSDALAKVDFAPTGFPSGDCVVDNQELEIMASDWLMMEDTIIPTDSNNITNGLVAYYQLNEGSGTTTTDNSSNGNDGTFSASGITWVTPGLLGNSAINVDGAPGGRISIGTLDPVGGPNGEFTLSLWARFGGTGNVSQGLIGKRDGWDDNTSLRFMFEVFGNNQLRLGSYVDDAYSQGGVMTPYIGRWAHIAATYNDDEPNNVRFYVNGQDVGEGICTLGTNTAATMTIGNTMSETAWPDSPETFNGDMDEVRIYDRTLTQAEIAYLADLTPEDGKLHVPLASPAELYGLEAEPARAIDFRDFAVIALSWVEEELWL